MEREAELDPGSDAEGGASAPLRPSAAGREVASGHDPGADAGFEPDGAPDPANRPERLEEFVGQERVREQLRIFVGSAASRGEPLDHVLLSGPPGLGKTTLARIVAAELGFQFHQTSAPAMSRAGDIVAVLLSLEPGTVLFVDEIHRLPVAAAEMLYSAMEDFRVDITVGEGAQARTHAIDLPPFTLVGATTRTGGIPGPLRDRFGIQLRLDYYSPEELRDVVARDAAHMGVAGSDGAWREIAARSRGTPRVAKRLLRRVRDVAVHEGRDVDAEVADRALGVVGVDANGLDELDRSYIGVLVRRHGGGPVGGDTLAAGVSEDRDTLETDVEPYLMSIGMVRRTPRGRVAGESAYEALGLKPGVRAAG